MLDCRGEPAWCGGSAALRAVLTALSERGGAVEIATVAECWRAAGGEPDRLSETLHANRHLLNTGTTRVELRLSLPGVHETVAQAVGST